MPKFRHYRHLWIASLWSLLLASPALGLPSSSPAIHLPQLPPLSALEEAALNRAGLNPQLIRRWEKNVRRAVALPRVQIGYDQKAAQQHTAVIQDSISVTSAGVNIGPAANRVDQDFGNNRGFEVKAVWALDELLFNRDELEISRESRDLLFMRTQLTQDLHQAYYDLKAQLLRFQMQPEVLEDPIEILKAEQLMDKLNSLTGGEFRRQLKEMKPVPGTKEETS